MSNPYQIKAAGENEVELLIYGDIGESWWGDSVTAKEVAEQLAELDVDTIVVRINSYGGSVSDGLAIFNVLRNHKATINVRIDGVAVSIASLIAMAGDTVSMSENAIFMVHAPWGGAVGNSKEMREYADMLDIYAKAMSSSYVRKTGQDNEVIMDLLTDGEDHWYTAAEASEFGYVDEIIEEEMAAAAGFDKSKFIPSALRSQAAQLKTIAASLRDDLSIKEVPQPAALVAANHQPMKEENSMEPKDKIKATDDQVVIDDALTKHGTEVEAKVVAAENERKTAIRAAFDLHPNHAGVSALLTDCLMDGTITVEAAQKKLLAKLGEGATPLAGISGLETGQDEHDKQVAAAQDVLLVRAGVNRMRGNGVDAMAIDLQGNPFVGASLMDMARASLKAAGKNSAGMDKREVVAMAFQGTSDFPVLLENTMHKVLLTAYMTAVDTWSRFCKIGSVSDFRTHNRYRTGSIGNLDTLGEHGEVKHKSIPDGEKGSVTATTKANIITITREAIINDDLQALTDLATMLGRAYKRTIEAAVYALLAENSGLGPTLVSDSKTLFHADHDNIGAGAAISMAAIDADRVLMANQTDVGGNDYLDLRPTKLLVPVGLGGNARTINDAVYDPDTANKLQKPNTVNGLFDDIIDTPRMSGTRRYTFADPNEAPVIEVAFLDGMQEPLVETKDGWSSAGAELKVLGDFGVGAIDYRGATTDAGV